MSTMSKKPMLWASTEIDELKGRLKTTWMTGDYDLFSRYLEAGARQFTTGSQSLREAGCSTSRAAPANWP